MATQKTQISSLPNEIMRIVLAKLEVQKLILVRGVSTHWRWLVEHICNEKRSLLLGTDFGCINIAQLYVKLNGLVDKPYSHAKCAVLTGRTTKHGTTISLTRDFALLLAALFPRVENLVIDFSELYCDSSSEESIFSLLDRLSLTIVTLSVEVIFNFSEAHHTLCAVHIDKLTALKRLHMRGAHFLTQATIARLEHCSIDKDDTGHVVPQLTTNCTSLHLFDHDHGHMAQLLQLNGQLVRGLTHLSFSALDRHLLPFVCGNFSSLKVLNIDFYEGWIDAETIAPIARLTKLTELSMKCFKLHLDSLVQANMPTVISVQTITLSGFAVRTDTFNGDQFCRNLAIIFPNVQQATIEHVDQAVRESISQHMNHFVQLRKHVIN